MATLQLPFEPMPTHLCEPYELLAGFDPDRPSSY